MRKAPAAAATVEAYVAAFPRAVRTQLEALRRAIHTAAPDAIETISYRIPTFKQDGRPLIYFAAYETHIGLYPVELDGSALGARLAPYASGRATLRFPLDRLPPLGLVAQVVRAKLRAGSKPPMPRRPRSAPTDRLNIAFSAVLQRSESPNGWTFVVWPKSAEFRHQRPRQGRRRDRRGAGGHRLHGDGRRPADAAGQCRSAPGDRQGGPV
jgi:uncharacterized protein YdhG (YjbR/CyaY superfamily)